MNKKMIIALAAFVAVIGLMAGLWFGLQNRPDADDGKAAAGTNTESTTGTDAAGNVVSGTSFTVVVLHASGEEKTFDYTTEESNLGSFLEAEGLIDSEGADAGMFHTVDGEKADWNENQSYWAFYIEDEYAMTGIYDTTITDGATYKLVYTIG